MRCLFGNRIKLIEFPVVVYLEIVGGPLHKERIVKLELQSSVASMGNRMASSKFEDISAIVEVHFALGPVEVVYFCQQRLLLSGTNLQLIDIAFILLQLQVHFSLDLIFLSRYGSFLP